MRTVRLLCLALLATAACAAADPATFVNPVAPHGADPWVIRHAGDYLYCRAEGGGIRVGRAARLDDVLRDAGTQVWRPEPGTAWSREIWAPELHYLAGRWFIYFAADDGQNAHHRMYVLEGRSQDPLGSYVLRGKLATPDDHWAIDGTVLALGDRLFFLWSGWEGDDNVRQDLYLAPMRDPTSLSGPRVRISTPEHDWERVGRPLVNEGPQALVHSGRVFVVYSASGSWTDSYCLGLLELAGEDPLAPGAWKKSPAPAFRGTTEVTSPGHASFTTSPDGREDWIVYHAARHPGAGWDRDVRMQRFAWTADGRPDFGAPAAPGVELALPAPAKPRLAVGVDANYSLGMEQTGAVWRWSGASTNLFADMAHRGVAGFRVRLWTREEGKHGRTYATEIVERAARAGLDPYLVIFLSEDWSDMMKQPLPAAWKALSFDERLAAVRAYSRDTVAHFRRHGVTNHLYEIGNEIDYGICGEYPGKSTKKSPASLERSLWPRSAQIIAASEAGVREADPDAQFLLHIAHWWDADFCAAFFQSMRRHGAQVDVAGLSYFPSANIGGSLEFEEFGATAERLYTSLGLPVVVPETAYPSTHDFTGQFSRWKYEAPGYPLTPDGQRRWLADFLAYCDRHPAVRAVYYWSPEWCGEGMWKGFALFDPDGAARPAWDALAQAAWAGRTLRSSRYFEVCSNQLFAVPVAEAKAQCAQVVAKLRAQTGGVTVEHIALLTNTELRVGAYRVDLKGSLQQNLRLARDPTAVGAVLDGADPLPAGFDPARERIVLFARGEAAAAAQGLANRIAGRGAEAVVHPVMDDAPLRFGMCGRFADADEEP